MADFSITMNNPVFPDGTEFIVVGFPASLINGETSTVPPEAITEYEEFTGNDFQVVAEGITGADTSGDVPSGDAPSGDEPTQSRTARRTTKKGGEE
jgi:hypothetical protein